jgi:hypothetical protein
MDSPPVSKRNEHDAALHVSLAGKQPSRAPAAEVVARISFERSFSVAFANSTSPENASANSSGASPGTQTLTAAVSGDRHSSIPLDKARGLRHPH